MEDEEQEQEQAESAFLFENCCRNSSSQEELLTHGKIAREDDEFPDDNYSPELVDSGEIFSQLDGGDEFGEMIEGEFVADDAELEIAGILGFRGEQKGEMSGTKLEGFCDEEREIELELKEFEVSLVVDCGRKMVIEGEDDGEEFLMFEGDLDVEQTRCLRSDDRGSGDCGENSGCECGGDDDVDMEDEVAEGGGFKRKLEIEAINVDDEEEDEMKKKMEFALDNDVIIVEDDKKESDAGKERSGGGESGNVEGDRKRGGDTSTSRTREEKQRKRELPRSMFGLVWGKGRGGRDRDRDRVVGNQNVEEEELCGEGNGGANRNVEEEKEESISCDEGSGDAIRNEVRVIGNDHVENGLEEAIVERNRDGVSEGCEEGKTRSVLDVLRFLAKEKSINEVGKIDHVETLKRSGMTFPCSRFLPEKVKDDDDDEEEEEDE